MGKATWVVDHLLITIIGSGEPTPNPLQCGGQNPALERCAIA
jgi:hypothetical protein